MSAEALRELVARLGTSANALSALGTALERAARPAEIRAALDDVLAALDVRLEGVPPAVVVPLLGEIRYQLYHASARLARGHGRRWAPTDPEVLQAAGDVSAGFPALLGRLLPHLPGLRLEAEGARFLDVGVGVAALSIAMARAWPALQVVGIDPWAPSLTLARENVRAADLQARIELRQQPVEELTDQAAFDLAWLPSAFIPAPAIPEALGRLRRALRPGGWLLFVTLNPGGPGLAAAVSRLRTLEWGGHPFTPAEATAALQAAGFVDLAPLPGARGAIATFLAARSP